MAYRTPDLPPQLFESEAELPRRVYRSTLWQWLCQSWNSVKVQVSYTSNYNGDRCYKIVIEMNGTEHNYFDITELDLAKLLNAAARFILDTNKGRFTYQFSPESHYHLGVPSYVVPILVNTIREYMNRTPPP